MNVTGAVVNEPRTEDPPGRVPALALHLTRYSLLSTSRNPRAVIFTLAFPIILLVLFNAIFANGDSTQTPQGRMDTSAYFTAGIMAYALTLSSYGTLAISLTTQRESGLLKRYRGTPMPAWTFIAAQVLRSIVLVAGMVAVFLVLGHIAYDVQVRAATLPGLVAFIVLGTATMCILGIALTAITTDADSASTIAPFSVIVLSFISGVFVPVDTIPGWLHSVGNVFPLARLATGLQAAFNPSTPAPGLLGGDLAVLAVWAIVGLVIAIRGFRWEPRAR